jgi:hypothetical protein
MSCCQRDEDPGVWVKPTDDNGIVEANGLSEERDIHAFVGSNQTGSWMLDNRCDENAGDFASGGSSPSVYQGLSAFKHFLQMILSLPNHCTPI